MGLAGRDCGRNVKDGGCVRILMGAVVDNGAVLGRPVGDGDRYTGSGAAEPAPACSSTDAQSTMSNARSSTDAQFTMSNSKHQPLAPFGHGSDLNSTSHGLVLLNPRWQ